MQRRWDFTLILYNKRYDVRLLLFDVLSFEFEDTFSFFETQAVDNGEIVLNDLLSTMPDTAFWGCEADVFALDEIDISHRTDINKIFESNITKA